MVSLLKKQKSVSIRYIVYSYWPPSGIGFVRLDGFDRWDRLDRSDRYFRFDGLVR
jgi:hypothetical protein